MSPTPQAPDLPSPSAPPTGAAGTPPPLRVLDKAPQHLRLAAQIVVAGSLLAWMPGRLEGDSGTWWLMTLLAKAIMGAAAWLWMQQVLHNFGPARAGVLGQLAELSLKPKAKPAEDEGKARRAKPRATAHLEHPFPTGLHALSLVLAVAALFVAAGDARLPASADLEGIVNIGIAEVAMLGWAAYTWVHIASYERWGSFSPLFPLMFLGMLFAGAAAVIGALTSDTASGMLKLMGVLGGAAVAAGGGLAAYTIAEAMMQAKKEGDRKKADALEARKAARQKKA